MSAVNLLTRLRKLGITIQLVNDKLKISGTESKLTPGLIDELKKRKGELIAFLQEKVGKRLKYESIDMVEEKEYYKLSSAQKRLYILQQLTIDNISYNLTCAFTLEPGIDAGKLEEIFRKLVLRHESLRTSFQLIEGEPVQRIHRNVEFKIEYYDLATEVEGRKLGSWEAGKIGKEAPFGQINACGGSDNEGTRGLAPLLIEPAAALIRSFIRPFDLSNAPLMRVGVIKAKESRQILVIDMHHIISDGFSINILVNDWAKLYLGKDLQPLMLQYRDYSEWQTGDKQKNSIRQQEDYWLKKLGCDTLSFKLPVDYAEPGDRNVEGDTVSFQLDQTLSADIQRITLETGATLYMMLLASYNVLLYFCSGNEDILVGSPVAGRPYDELNNILGMFVNMLVMRNSPGGNKTFKEFLTEVKENTLEAFRNQDYQFDELIYKLGFQGDSSGNPLIKTVFTFQNTGSWDIDIDAAENDKPNLTIKAYPYKIDGKKFDLTLDAIEVAGILKGWFTYSTNLFKRTTIERMKRNYTEILKHMVKDINIKLKDVPVSRDLASPKSEYLRTDQDDFGF